MDLKNIKIDEILQKEVSRTEFLGLVGAGLLSIVGISSLMKNLGDIFGKSHHKPVDLGYGSSTYGGSVKSSGITNPLR